MRRENKPRTEYQHLRGRQRLKTKRRSVKRNKEVGERRNFGLARRDYQKSEWLTGSNATEKSG